MRTILKAIVVVAFFYLVYLLVGQVLVLGWLHDFVQNHFGDITGADQAVIWLVVLALFSLLRLVKWRSLLVAPVTGGTKALLAFAAVCLAAAVVLKFTNARILFDASGNPRQSFVETADGRVILDAPPGGIDPRTGLRRQALTAEVLRAINIGHKAGALSDTNRYFNSNDGLAKTWFVPGSCEAKAAPGFDDRGRRLVPATAEMVEHCEKLKVEAEQRHQRETDAQARRELYQKQKTRQREFREIGVYTAIGRFTALDGAKITFEECVVLRHETRLRFRISGLKDTEVAPGATSRFEFSLLNADGTETRPSSVHRAQGNVAVAHQDGIVLPPNPGESGRVVVGFPRDSESGGFSIAVNRAIVFTNPAGHISRFRKF